MSSSLHVSAEDMGGVVRGCPTDFMTVPVTFKNEKGFVKLTGYEGSYSMNVSLEFRFVSLRLFYRRGLRPLVVFRSNPIIPFKHK